jgi:hypothetical protein
MQVRQCYNRKPYVSGYRAMDGYWVDTNIMTHRAVWIENRMSKDCHQDKGAECAGCKWEKTNED